MTNRIRSAKEQRDQGFTLIELLVVIIIIGILAAIAIPVFLNQRQKGVDAGMKSDAKNAATAVETWITDNPQTAITDQPSVTSDSTPTGELAGFKASPGNTINLAKGTEVGSYCIDVQNDASSEPEQFVVYDSSSGGLQEGWQVSGCTTTP